MATPLYESEYELEALPELEGESEGELEGELEGEAGLEGEGWLGAIGNVVGSLLGEQEFEGEFEGEFESEVSPIRKIYPDAMMEHLGELAAEAETEQEAAEHFLPLVGMAAGKLLPVVAKAVAPLARKALPRLARAVTRATPHLTRGIGKIAKSLHRNPQTRTLLRTVPTIARRTVGSIARQAARGRPVTPRSAVMTLARQTQRVLGNRRNRVNALRRHNHLERRFHRRWGRVVRPHWRYGRAPYGAPGAIAGPRYQAAAGTVGVPGVRYGRVVGGQCVCPACGTGHVVQAPAVSTAPAYCRCCGQLLR
ncbi:MAG: hypothetical protein LAO23_04510 [Acidobacteriia bacterium]|nr:hypothetical protein [Terriglobia bacterium]